MKIRLRAAIDLAFVLVISFVAGRLVRVGLPEWGALALAMLAVGLAVHDIMQAGLGGRPLWRSRHVDGPRSE